MKEQKDLTQQREYQMYSNTCADINNNNKRLIPISAEMLVRSDERICGYDLLGSYSTTFMMYFPYVVVDEFGKLVGIASRTDIQRYIMSFENSYINATFYDVVNQNAESYYLPNIPISPKHSITIIKSLNNVPRMIYLSAERFISGVFIDIIDACNLRCPNCLRGCREIPNSADKMGLDDFENIIKTLSQKYNINSFALFNWMEPFLVNDLNKYFDILDKYGCKGSLSTNLSLENIQRFESVFAHNALEMVLISVSGFTNEIHSVYHRDSDINIVKSNMEKISKLKISRRPECFIYVKYLKFDYNEGDIPLFKQYTENLGFAFSVFRGWGNREVFTTPQKTQTIQDRIGHSLCAKPVDTQFCCSMFNQIVINARCEVFACCDEPTIETLKIGNILTDSIEDIFVKKFFYPGCRSCKIPKNVPMNDRIRKIIIDAVCGTNQEEV